ncbi:MAG: YciI family protein [Solirubrobacteraceae bacterium]
MKYALLAYSGGEGAEERAAGEIHPAIAAVLERSAVTGWLRLHSAESATTLRREARRPLLTDGPFVDSKEFLGGLILIDADDLDGALAVAAELQELGFTAGIEVRPVLEQELGGA